MPAINKIRIPIVRGLIVPPGPKFSFGSSGNATAANNSNCIVALTSSTSSSFIYSCNFVLSLSKATIIVANAMASNL